MNEPTSMPLIRDARPADVPVIVEFNRCLALETEGKTLDGAVLLSGVSRALADPERLRYWVAELGSSGTVVGQGKDKKILVFRYKPKKRVRKLNGHRQPYAEIKITKITLP